VNAVRSHSVAEIVAAGLGARYTAAVLRIERAGRPVFEHAFGRCGAAPDEPAVTVTTRFDLASLTKVFVATSALEAVPAGRTRLDDPACAHLEEWRGTAHEPITLRMLLAHTAGLKSGADYRTLFAESVERYALLCPLVAAPGSRVVYSDLGFIALGVLLARIARSSLATVFAGTARRLELEGTSFRPRNDDPRTIPATEEDAWRGRVRGSVHDEKASMMNGVAGHAGLFGTARDVAAIAERYLGAAHGRGDDAFSRTVAREAIAEAGADPVLRRGLGWALKTSDDNSCGALMDRSTFGHTGFTGTCVWADPVRDLSVVLLTNAVYYGRNDLRPVRAAVCDAAVREFG
jgi:CubicO group peptidase (beta-lactamase class C family)